MKRHDLKIQTDNGDRNPANVRYFIDGRRVTESAYRATRKAALETGTLTDFSNASSGGVTTFYCTASLP